MRLNTPFTKFETVCNWKWPHDCPFPKSEYKSQSSANSFQLGDGENPVNKVLNDQQETKNVCFQT